jgi:hypothetical protein
LIGFIKLKTLTFAQKWGMLFAAASLAVELVAQVFLRVFRNTIYAYEFYDIAIVILGAILYVKCIESKYWKFVVLYVFGFVAAKVTEWIFFDGFTHWTFSTTFFPAMFLILVSLRYFYTTFRDSNEYSLTKTPLFWIAAALFIYNASTLFVFIFSSYILVLTEQAELDLWVIIVVLNILFNVLLTIALWMKPSSKESTSLRS